MKNPWLQVPAGDYEAHMSSPEVAQSQALEAIFKSAVNEFDCSTIAIFGCATGNGFQHIGTSHTDRVTGIDINPDYLDITRHRYGEEIPCLELIEADFSAPGFSVDPVSLVISGLIFEYVNVRETLKNIKNSMLPGAVMVSVLQLPSAESAPVTTTRYKSLECLSPFLKLVEPEEFRRLCSEVGLSEFRRDTVPLKMGKAFYTGYYTLKD